MYSNMEGAVTQIAAENGEYRDNIALSALLRFYCGRQKLQPICGKTQGFLQAFYLCRGEDSNLHLLQDWFLRTVTPVVFT